jgi:hypothetical protein
MATLFHQLKLNEYLQSNLMHGFTNYQQSKALYERGYRHPKPILLTYIYTEYPAFSLADIVTMQGERFYMPPQVSVAEVIEYNMKYLLENDDVQVQECNQRLRGEYE